MKKICISDDWKFKNLTSCTEYESIDLPHDYQIKQKRNPDGYLSNGFFPDMTGKYVKYLKLAKGRHYIVDIDGAYMCSHIMFNEHTIAMHPYGYTPFLADITPYVFDNITNKLIITTAPLQDTSRWYTGNGIYRDVFLWEGGEHRIEPWDIFVSTVDASEKKGTIRVKYTVSSDFDAKLKLDFDVRNGGESVCVTSVEMNAVTGKNEGELLIDIPKPQLWDIDKPQLYELHTSIMKDGTVTDRTETTFGIRTVSADVENGLLLNGRPVKLRGGCIHHDHGELGAAAFPAAELRKVSKLKDAGFNVIRCTHNPPSLAFLEVCDRLGMIVMDEAFDVWEIQKRQFDYHIFFADWWARDISYMVLRDRNHPCVFSYSIGNELLEVSGMADGDRWSEMLSDEIRKYDDTRFVTAALQKAFARRFVSVDDTDPEDYRTYFDERFEMLKNNPKATNEVTAGIEKSLDIVGLNYYYKSYKVDYQMYPERVVWGSETKAIKFYDSWKEAEENSFVLGDFTWTAYDNLGEAGAGRIMWSRDGDIPENKLLKIADAEYPWRNCYQGDFDLCGFRRPQSYFREAIWKKNTEPRIFVTHPEHFGETFVGTDWHWYDVDESWTYDDIYIGRPIRVETYTVADEVEWYINDKFAGKSKPIKAIASLDTVYERGSIRAVAFKNGEKLSEYTLHSAEKASVINMYAEKEKLIADGRDLCYVPISITDKDGRLVVADEREITCKVNGGELLALFSGNPMSTDEVISNKCHTFKGHALAVIRSKEAGTLQITVHSEGLAGCSVSVPVVAE